jgi:hypothetical protein
MRLLSENSMLSDLALPSHANTFGFAKTSAHEGRAYQFAGADADHAFSSAFAVDSLGSAAQLWTLG